MSPEESTALIARDQSEGDELGQQLRNTFTLSDVFVQSGDEKQLDRFLDIVFGHPFSTPTPDEQAMFLAYGASMRSGQLARQVGAVIVSAIGEINRHRHERRAALWRRLVLAGRGRPA
jgi:deoxycytidylate deaminase